MGGPEGAYNQAVFLDVIQSIHKSLYTTDASELINSLFAAVPSPFFSNSFNLAYLILNNIVIVPNYT